MILSRTERYILIGAVVALAALALDRFALSPMLDMRAAAEKERAALASRLERDHALVARRAQVEARWNEMIRTGLKPDATEAESQVFHAMRDWAEDSGVALSLLKPERSTEKTRLPEIAFQAAGTGSMSSVARLLWLIQSASIPIKTTELQISARKEGVDDLSFQVRVSTICQPLHAAPSPAPRGKPAGTGEL